MENTGNKFNDLYELSKKLKQHQIKTDKTNQDYEYEKSKDQCTFTPNLLRYTQSIN